MSRVGFTFIWKIENFSFVPKFSKNKEIVSPSFVARNLYETLWCLRLRPAGYSTENRDKFLFHLHKFPASGSSQKNPNCISLDYELSILYNGHSKDKSVTESAFWFHAGNSLGTPLSVTLDEIFNKGGILPRDTLTVQCNMWLHVEPCLASCSTLARTRIDVERLIFYWSIDNFSTLKVDDKKSTNVVIFPQHSINLKLTLFITGGPDSGEKVQIQIAIEGKNEKINNFSILAITVQDTKGESVHHFENEFMFQPSFEQCWRFPLILDKNQLVEAKGMLLPGDVLSLKCELLVFDIILNRIDFSAIGRNSSSDIETALTYTNESLRLGKRKRCSSSNSLTNDMRYLLEEKHHADATLRLQNETFLVHKAILAARSSVFKTMFDTDMKEKLTNIIEIDDIEADTMRQLLLYIYSDTLNSDIEWKIACDLYLAAEKYDVLGLKKKCSSYLMVNLNVTNVCETLLLAETLRDDDLKDFIQSFIEGNDKAVLNSKEWKDFTVKHPKLAIDTFTRLYKNVKQI